MKKIKMKTGKKIDWNLLTKDLMGSLFINQQALAERCRVSQQSISNWKNKTRTPGIFAKQMLFKLAQKEKINISKYETYSNRDILARYFEKNK